MEKVIANLEDGELKVNILVRVSVEITIRPIPDPDPQVQLEHVYDQIKEDFSQIWSEMEGADGCSSEYKVIDAEVDTASDEHAVNIEEFTRKWNEITDQKG